MARERPPQLTDFGDLMMPAEAIEPILARPVRAALIEWLTEIWAEDALAEVGVAPRRRAIFDGPPGVGKTTLAHHLAARLGLPMLAVRPDRIISKWVGESGRNIGAMFDLAGRGLVDGSGAATPVLLFIDEFDAIARQRRASEQAADDSRNEEVNVLLQRLEQHAGFVIAATNFAGDVDQAIWRRFHIHITLELPGQDERERIAARYLAPFGMSAHPMSHLAQALETASPGLIKELCENLKRQIVLGPRLGSDMALGPTIDRVIASSHPHPKIGKPRLWSLGAKDPALAVLPWPLPRAADVVEPAAPDPAASPPPASSVVAFGRKG